MISSRPLNVGILGCGPISQAAHFESANKARNATLYAICDVADDLRARMAATHAPQKSFASYEAMLADPDLDAVVIATADAFHVAAAIQALRAGKHVLCEKPLGVSVEEVEALRAVVRETGCVLQVGNMKRFDPGIQSAKAFIDAEMGQMLALKAWYCDSTHRYAVTDAQAYFATDFDVIFSSGFTPDEILAATEIQSIQRLENGQPLESESHA